MDELFKKQVYEIIRLVPPGRVTSYGTIAKAVGFPNHARHVGNVLGDCADDVPAHRVCNASGHITASCLRDFVEKLGKEGVMVKDKKIRDFRKIFWDPLLELR